MHVYLCVGVCAWVCVYIYKYIDNILFLRIVLSSLLESVTACKEPSCFPAFHREEAKQNFDCKLLKDFGRNLKSGGGGRRNFIPCAHFFFFFAKEGSDFPIDRHFCTLKNFKQISNFWGQLQG